MSVNIYSPISEDFGMASNGLISFVLGYFHHELVFDIGDFIFLYLLLFWSQNAIAADKILSEGPPFFSPPSWFYIFFMWPVEHFHLYDDDH